MYPGMTVVSPPVGRPHGCLRVEMIVGGLSLEESAWTSYEESHAASGTGASTAAAVYEQRWLEQAEALWTTVAASV